MTAAVRRAGRGDVPALVALMEEFYAESGFPLDRAWAAASFEALLSKPDLGAVWLLTDDGAVGGHVVLTVRFSMEYGGLDAFVDDLFVRPGRRRRGLARAGLRALVDECTRRGVRAVHVVVGADSPEATALYEAFGFRAPRDARRTLTLETPGG